MPINRNYSGAAYQTLSLTPAGSILDEASLLYNTFSGLSSGLGSTDTSSGTGTTVSGGYVIDFSDSTINSTLGSQ